MATRIYRDRFYVLSRSVRDTWGNYTARESVVVTGHKAANERGRCEVLGEFSAQASDMYRVEDGHLPDHQPRMNGLQVVEWLRANPYGVAAGVGAACASAGQPACLLG